MSAFVVVSFALAVVAVGVVVVVIRYLWQAIARLRRAVHDVNARLVPLTKELTAELAVTSIEAEELGKAVQRISRDRATRKRRRQGLRPKRKKRGMAANVSSRLRNRG